jgi:CRISPR-associated protein Cas2
MADRIWHLVAYDIRDATRLRKVAKKLGGYGDRIQYSIFRCRLDKLSLEKLRWELSEILAPEDDLLVMPICTNCAAKIPIHSTGDQSEWVDRPPSFRIL